MRITQAEVIPIRIPKKSPFRVAYATRTACLGMLLHVKTDDGHSGWGEAVPVREVTGEDRAIVFGRLRTWAAQHLVGRDPFAAEELRRAIAGNLAGMPSAQCAVDTALWDVRGQALGLSMWELLGRKRSWHWASASIGIKSVDETAAEAQTFLRKGFHDLKVKIGLDPDQDVARVLALRQRLGLDWRLYLDANQGYTVEQAIQVTHRLAEGGAQVELIEQPVPAGDLEGLARVTCESPIPICADEAVKDPASLISLIRLRAAHMINVKLMKCGGPTVAALMVHMAEAAGMRAMIGCMIESRVGITAGLHVALALDNVKYIDLDGAFDLADDIVSPDSGAQYQDGKQFLAIGQGTSQGRMNATISSSVPPTGAPAPGLGVRMDLAAVRRNTDHELQP